MGGEKKRSGGRREGEAGVERRRRRYGGGTGVEGSTLRARAGELTPPMPLYTCAETLFLDAGDEFIGTMFDTLYQGNATAALQALLRVDAMVSER